MNVFSLIVERPDGERLRVVATLAHPEQKVLLREFGPVPVGVVARIAQGEKVSDDELRPHPTAVELNPISKMTTEIAVSIINDWVAKRAGFFNYKTNKI
jgi:hypothetical protein